MTADYDNIAPFYDKIHGSRKETIKYVKQLLKENHPKAKNILSLACGTGVVEKVLSKKYDVSGLDISPEMLTHAQKLLPKATFYNQDMTTFTVPDTFDVILCLFASLNHVAELDDWVRMFRRVKEHLNPGGVFIFDVLSELCLYNLVLNTPMITRRGKLVVIGEFLPEEDGVVNWAVHGHHVKGAYQDKLFETETKTVAFDLERIQSALEEIFSEVTVEDPEHEGVVSERSELLYFICKV